MRGEASDEHRCVPPPLAHHGPTPANSPADVAVPPARFSLRSRLLEAQAKLEHLEESMSLISRQNSVLLRSAEAVA